eukprot:4477523-Pyramimonas_sp.AAC.1
MGYPHGFVNMRTRRAKVDGIMGCRHKEYSQVCRQHICVFPGSGTRPPHATKATARRLEGVQDGGALIARVP